MKNFIMLITFLLISATGFGQETSELQKGTTEEQYVPKVIIEAKVGSGEGEFGIISQLYSVSIGPNVLIIDKEKNIYVLDPVNTRILKFNNQGKYLNTINLEQRRATRKTKNPVRLFAEKNPKAFKDMYNKSPEDFPEWDYIETNAIDFDSNQQEIQVDEKGNIYHLLAPGFGPQCYALIIYNKNGKIIRGYSQGEIDEEEIDFHDLNMDKEGKVYFKVSSKYGVEIDLRGRISKFEWAKLDNETKTDKFKEGLIEKRKRKIQDLSALSPELKNSIIKSKDDLGLYIQPAEDDEGNVYEIVWNVLPLYFSKGTTKIIWNKKMLPQGVKIIKWQKIK